MGLYIMVHWPGKLVLRFRRAVNILVLEFTFVPSEKVVYTCIYVYFLMFYLIMVSYKNVVCTHADYQMCLIVTSLVVTRVPLSTASPHPFFIELRVNGYGG